MKTSIKFNVHAYYFMVLMSLLLVHCNGNSNKNGLPSGIENKITQKKLLKDSVQLQEENIRQQSIKKDTFQQKSESEVSKNAIFNNDPDKIYEQSEVDKEADCLLNNSQLLDFCIKNFKNYKNFTVEGRIKMDLVIEKDGRISDVIIVEGLHPVLDNDVIRVFKLMPNFKPGEINGRPVRSKFRMPFVFRVGE